MQRFYLIMLIQVGWNFRKGQGVFRDVMPARDVAIRNPRPQIGFDSMALGVPTDGAGPRHTITRDAAQHNNPTAGGAAWAGERDNSAIPAAPRVPRPPCFV
jgi:hypothetical protein